MHFFKKILFDKKQNIIVELHLINVKTNYFFSLKYVVNYERKKKHKFVGRANYSHGTFQKDIKKLKNFEKI